MSFNKTCKLNASIPMIAAILAAATSTKANLIANGNFEDASQWGTWYFDPTPAGSSPGPAGYDFGIRDASGFGNGSPSNGNYVGGLDWVPGTVSLSQTVSDLVVGAQYALSFELNLRDPGGVPPPDTFRVQVDGNTIFFCGDPFTYANSYMPISTSFVATNSNSTTITFLGQIDSDTAYNFDNVTLEIVPEPVSLVLISLGVLGLRGGAARRQFTITEEIHSPSIPSAAGE